MQTVNMLQIQEDVRNWYATLDTEPTCHGRYRESVDGSVSFYATADMAIIRWLIGEDVRTLLTNNERQSWIDHINDFQNSDGSYGPEMNHHLLHAHGTAINALSILGGVPKYSIQFYNSIQTAHDLLIWLETLDFSYPWPMSHLIWGGLVPFMHVNKDESWREALFQWLNDSFDPARGSWKKGVKNLDRPIADLGCAVHFYPLYRHLNLKVPGIERMAELVLDLQGNEGGWCSDEMDINRRIYGSMDALYVLMVGMEQVPHKSAVYRKAMTKYLTNIQFSDFFGNKEKERVHWMLGWLSSLGYLQRALPEKFSAEVKFGDIFDQPVIYKLSTV